MKRTKGAFLLAATLGVLGLAPGAAHTAAEPRRDQLPNLVPLAPHDLTIAKVDDGNDPALRFAVSIANKGEYAFELVGRPEGYLSGSDTTAEQCVAWATPRTCSARRSIGTLGYHDAHGHYHFEDFALYELRRLKKNGMPNMRKKGLVATSEKVSFCLQDVTTDGDPGPLYATPWPLYYGCFAGMGIQGISPGWLDIYGWRTTGQQIPLTGIADGTYALVIHTDPGNRVFEADDEDNVAVAGVVLTQDGKKVEAVCASNPGALRCR